MDNEVNVDASLEAEFDATAKVSTSEVPSQSQEIDIDDLSWDSVEDTVHFEDKGNEDTENMDEGNASEEAEKKVEEDSSDESDQKEEADAEEGDKESQEPEQEVEPPSPIELPEHIAEKGIIAVDGALGKMVTIDGKQEFVSLEDLGNDFSGQKALARRFTEFNNIKKEYMEQYNQINGYLNNFGEMMRNQDVLGAFQYFGEFSKLPPHQIKEALINALEPEIFRRANLSDSELKAEQLQEQNNYLKELNESEVKRREFEQNQSVLNDSILRQREAHNISEEEWTEAQTYLSEQVNKEELSPEVVSEYVVNLRAYDKAGTVIDQFDFKEQLSDSFIDTLQQVIIRNPDFTDEDLSSLVKDTYEASYKASLGKKIIDRQAKQPIKKEVKEVEPKLTQKQSIEEEVDPELEDLF